MNSATISTPRLLSANETAKMLGVTVRTLHTYTEQKHLKRVKIGNRNQYDIDDVRAFIESHKSCS